jgi:hypothetical protein
MEFLNNYMEVFRVAAAYVFSIGAGVGATALCAVFVSSALYGLWVLITKTLKISTPSSYNKPFTAFAIFSIVLFLPLGFAVYTSMINRFHSIEAERAYSKGWIFKEERAERFVLVHIDPPKHAYVTIRHVATGTVYERQYVGKHCNDWRSIPEGDIVTIRYNYYVHGSAGTTKIEFQDLKDVFC